MAPGHLQPEKERFLAATGTARSSGRVIWAWADVRERKGAFAYAGNAPDCCPDAGISAMLLCQDMLDGEKCKHAPARA